MKLSSLGFLALLFGVSACTFPEVDIGSGGHTTSAATSTAASSSKGPATSSDGLTSSSGTASTSSVTSSDSSSASTGTGEMCPCLQTTNCDCDGDGVQRYDAAHGCTTVADDAAHRDCNDCDPTVHPGQTSFFGTGGPNDFDYNCNGTKDPKYVEGTCASRTGLSPNGGCNVSFLEFSATCGTMVTVDACIQGLTVANPCQVDHTNMIPLPCN